MSKIVRCPTCQGKAKLINTHWVDPLVKCQDRSCVQFPYTKRLSKCGKQK